MKKAIEYADRCRNVFEVKPKGLRYVTRRWQCKRKKMNGLPYCSYCEPPWEKRERLEKKRKSA